MSYSVSDAQPVPQCDGCINNWASQSHHACMNFGLDVKSHDIALEGTLVFPEYDATPPPSPPQAETASPKRKRKVVPVSVPLDDNLPLAPTKLARTQSCAALEEDASDVSVDIDAELRAAGKLVDRAISTWQAFKAGEANTHWSYSRLDMNGKRKLVYCIKVNGPSDSNDVTVRPYKSFEGVDTWVVRGIDRVAEGPCYRFYVKLNNYRKFPTAAAVIKAKPVKSGNPHVRRRKVKPAADSR